MLATKLYQRYGDLNPTRRRSLIRITSRHIYNVNPISGFQSKCTPIYICQGRKRLKTTEGICLKILPLIRGKNLQQIMSPGETRAGKLLYRLFTCWLSVSRNCRENARKWSGSKLYPVPSSGTKYRQWCSLLTLGEGMLDREPHLSSSISYMPNPV